MFLLYQQEGGAFAPGGASNFYGEVSVEEPDHTYYAYPPRNPARGVLRGYLPRRRNVRPNNYYQQTPNNYQQTRGSYEVRKPQGRSINHLNPKDSRGNLTKCRKNRSFPEIRWYTKNVKICLDNTRIT